MMEPSPPPVMPSPSLHAGAPNCEYCLSINGILKSVELVIQNNFNICHSCTFMFFLAFWGYNLFLRWCILPRVWTMFFSILRRPRRHWSRFCSVYRRRWYNVRIYILVHTFFYHRICYRKRFCKTSCTILYQ